MTAEYRVQLDAFEGPLDLLLHLIRRAEVEITDIPIASLTDQYLGYLEQIPRVDVETAGEFLVMAATLMEIKSRVVAAEGEGRPREGPEDGDDEAGSPREDPRQELVRQLLEYKRYRDAADRLEARHEERLRRFDVAPAGVSKEELREAMEARLGDVELEDLSLPDLVAAFERIAGSINFDRVGEHEVTTDETPIELHAADIVDRLDRDGGPGRQLLLREVLEGQGRAEMIGLFLALLDLVRQGRVTFRQSQDEAGTRGEIEIVALDGALDAAVDGAAEASAESTEPGQSLP